MKKVLLITGILVIIAGVAFFLFGRGSGTTSETPGFSFRDFLPFGQSTDNTGSENVFTTGESPTLPQDNGEVAKLRKISNEPVAGYSLFNTSSTTIVRFVEKGTGNVYEANSLDNKIERLTNTTIPKIIRAFWLPDGSGFLAQTISNETELIETRFVKLIKNNATSSENLTAYNTEISNLPTGIKEISISPDGKKVFYYTTDAQSKWFISNPNGTGETFVYTSPLLEWIPDWVAENKISMQTKSSFLAAGYSYIFDTKNKTLRKTGPVSVGLSSKANSDISSFLVSIGGTFPQLAVFDTKTNLYNRLDANTLTEKCTWLNTEKMFAYCAVPNNFPTGNYPDDWYKGKVSTKDFVEKVDLIQNLFYRIGDLSDLADEDIDVIDIKSSKDDSHVVFRNKNDGFLWILRITD